MSGMRISDWFRGTAEVELFGAFPAGVLNAAAAEGLRLWDVESRDENTLRLHAEEAGLAALRRLADKSACEMRILRRGGGRGARRRLLRRPALLLGAALMAGLLPLSSLFVWDVRVQGAERLSRAEVLRALEDCGFGVGSFWPGRNTDLLCSEVMLRLPDIAWMTVNVSGSRAVVAVAERTEKPLMYDSARPADLVAARDGLVHRVNALAGRAAVREGEIVTAGQVLVSGTLESPAGGAQQVRARGAVMAETWVERSALCPAREQLKTPSGIPRSRFALVLGKKRVNLYIDSGKTIDGCDKIVSEYTLGLQGLFSTPLRLVRERFVPYETRPGDDYDPGRTGRQLYARLEESTEGQILSYTLTPGRRGEAHVLTLRAHCLENIARLREYG